MRTLSCSLCHREQRAAEILRSSLDVLGVFKANPSVEHSAGNGAGKGEARQSWGWSQRAPREAERFLLCFGFFPVPPSVIFNPFLPPGAATSPWLWWIPISIISLRQLSSFPKGLG